MVGEEVLGEGDDEEEGVDSLETWKLRRVVKEKREKEARKKREKEGMVARGKEMGRSREEVKKLRSEYRDWMEQPEVEEVSYILGEEVEKVKEVALDMEVRRWGKELRELVSKLGLVMEKRGDEVVEVRSEVVLPRGEDRGRVDEKEMGNRRWIEEGRSYSEVIMGAGQGIKREEVRKVEGKVRVKRRVMEESLMEKEERFRNKVKVVMDSQDEDGSGGLSGWSSGQVEQKLGLKKGEVVRVEGRKWRVVVEVKSGEVRDKIEEVGKKEWEEAVGRRVKSMGSLDSWAGMVVPAIEVGM